MTSAERAARLAKAQDAEADAVRRAEHAAAAKRRHGAWTWRPIGREVQFRSRTLPTLRLDMLRAEASDLMRALAKALGERPPSTPRLSKRERSLDTKARRAWDKAHADERALALAELAKEFRETGGW